ncbi:DsbA family protein [Microbacterium laevaniformans]|uniref:DsbA family protein n=1 Tax=Microbacterium laevaniformans TaxID=36807 RepID=UPI0036375E8D
MAQAAAGKRNWFAIWVSVAVVVVVGLVIGLVVWMNNVSSGPGAQPSSSNINTDTGAISFGSGPDVVDTYVDFMCPYCGQFEKTEGDTIKQLISENKITLNLHPVTILDRASQGTKFSSRSASAMFAIAEADPANAYAFMVAMYQNQPQESTPGLTDDQIVSVAKQAGVNVTSDLEQAITSGKYVKFAQSKGLPQGAQGTPTLLVNGKNVPVTYNPQTDIVANLKG